MYRVHKQNLTAKECEHLCTSTLSVSWSQKDKGTDVLLLMLESHQRVSAHITLHRALYPTMCLSAKTLTCICLHIHLFA